MKFGEFVGDRNNPSVRLVCQQCDQEVFTMGSMTFDGGDAVLEIESPEHEHQVLFEKRIVTKLSVK